MLSTFSGFFIFDETCRVQRVQRGRLLCQLLKGGPWAEVDCTFSAPFITSSLSAQPSLKAYHVTSFHRQPAKGLAEDRKMVVQSKSATLGLEKVLKTLNNNRTASFHKTTPHQTSLTSPPKSFMLDSIYLGETSVCRSWSVAI